MPHENEVTIVDARVGAERGVVIDDQHRSYDVEASTAESARALLNAGRRPQATVVTEGATRRVVAIHDPLSR